MTIESESSIRALELGRLITEYFELQRAGDAPTPDDYIAEHPEHELALRAVLPGASLLDQLGQRAEDAADPIGRSGDRIGEFKLLGILGRGGMGVVYEAVQETLERPVALKVLPASRVVDRKSRERFMREAQAAASLQHPGIVPVYGVGEADGQVYYAMQRIDGVPLDVLSSAARGATDVSDSTGTLARASALVARMRSRVLGGAAREVDASTVSGRPRAGSSSTAGAPTASRRPWIRNAVKIALLATEAVSYAHSRGVLHRDIKPSNVMLDEAGRVYLTDFGLCKTSDGSSLTAAGDVVGTLRYVPPERFQGRDDARGDVYGVGMVLYELLCGRAAFPQEGRAELVQAVTLHAPPRPRKLNRDIPSDLEGIVLKAIAKLPEERYASAEALIADLAAFLDGRPIVARAPGKLYLARLFLRRNRGLVLTAALSLLAIAIASSFYAVELRRLVHELDDANDSALHAVYHAEVTAAANLITTGREFLAGEHLQDVPVEARDWVWQHLVARSSGPSLTVGEGESAIRSGSLGGTEEHLVIVRTDEVAVHDTRTGELLSRTEVPGVRWAAELPGSSALAVVTGEEMLVGVVQPEGTTADANGRAFAESLATLDLHGVDACDTQGRFVAFACVDGRVAVLDGGAPSEPRLYFGPVGQGAKIALFGSEGAVVRGLTGTRSAIYGPGPERVRRLDGPITSNARDIDGATDAPSFVVLGGRSKVLRFTDDGGDEPLSPTGVVPVDGATHRIALRHDGQAFLVVAPRGNTRMWQLGRGMTRGGSQAMAGSTSFFAWPRGDGEFLAAGKAGEWWRVALPTYGYGAPGISRDEVTHRYTSDVAMDRASRYYLAVDETGTWSLWSDARRLPVAADATSYEFLRAAALEADAGGPLALAIGGDRLQVWRRSPARPEPSPAELRPANGAFGDVLACGFFGDTPGALLGVVCASGDVYVATHAPEHPGGWAVRRHLAVGRPIEAAAFQGTTGLLWLGAGDGTLLRTDLTGPSCERVEAGELGASIVALAVDRHGPGELLVAVTGDRNMHLLGVDGSEITPIWAAECASKGQDLSVLTTAALDETSGWIVMGTPDGRVRTWSVHRGRPGPTLLDAYSVATAIEFKAPGEPPLVYERSGRISHFELDAVDRSGGGPAVERSEREVAALDAISPTTRLELLEAALERSDLSLSQLERMACVVNGIRTYGHFNRRKVPGKRADEVSKRIEARIEAQRTLEQL